jgi:hypothetical protein
MLMAYNIQLTIATKRGRKSRKGQQIMQYDILETEKKKEQISLCAKRISYTNLSTQKCSF